MAKSASNTPNRASFFSAKGVEASRLRRRKFALVRGFGLPEHLLGGSLVLSRRRCGKPSCRCVDGDGHPLWTLTYCVDGKKHVDNIPKDVAEELMPLIEDGRAYRSAVNDLRAINAQLLKLWQFEQKAKKAKSRSRGRARPRR